MGKSEKRTIGFNSVSKSKKLCHTGFTEIYANILVGMADDVEDHLDEIDVLVPLNAVSGGIWDLGFRGAVYYIPIKDYSVLPKDVEAFFVDKILNIIKSGKRIAIFCVGGHGRTGYFTSLLLGKLGIDDPIEYMRARYCYSAVETNSQVEAIADFLEKPELKNKHKMYDYSSYYKYDFWNYLDEELNSHNNRYNNKTSSTNNTTEQGVTGAITGCRYCRECQSFSAYQGSYSGRCSTGNKTVWAYDEPCGEAYPRNGGVTDEFEEYSR